MEPMVATECFNEQGREEENGWRLSSRCNIQIF